MRYFILFFVLILTLSNFAFAEQFNDSANLKADFLSYSEDTRQLIASSNVQLTYTDVEVLSPWLIMDVDQQVMWGTGNITLRRGEDTIKSSSFLFDLEKNKVQVKDVNIAIKPKEIATGNLYLKVKTLEDNSDFKLGQGGFATTCDAEPPHYAVYADRFEYYPDAGMVGYNVWIDSPIYFIPFGVWLPVYHYALGKRNPILLMPLFGENNVEGFFTRTTWDYFINHEQYGLAYLDFITKKGVGYGFNHAYNLKNIMQGSIFLYQLQEQDTGIGDYNIRLDHTQNLTPELDLKLGYENVKGYTLSGGRKENNSNNLGFIYKDLGDNYSVNYGQQQNVIQSTTTQVFKLNKSFNNYQELNFDYTENNYSFNHSNQKEAILNQAYQLPEDMEFTDRLRYSSNLYDGDVAAEENLYTSLVLTKKFGPKELLSSLKMEGNFYMDLDGNKIVRNNNTAYLNKIPEITALFPRQTFFENNPYLTINIDKQLIIGEYREAKYIYQTSKMRILEGERIRYEQNINTKINRLFLDSSLDLNVNYSQNLYGTRTTNLLNGDRLFTVNQSYLHNLDLAKSINNKLQYLKKESAGYTPFFFDDDTQTQETITDTFTLYYQDITKYFSSHSFGWDKIKDYPLDYTTEFNVKPNNQYRFNLRTGFHFAEDNWKNLSNGYWQDLYAAMDYTPTGNSDYLNITLLRINATYSFRKGELSKLTKTLNFNLGKTWEDSWEVSTVWEYDAFSKVFQLSTVGLVKDLHCREMRLSYSQLNKEWRFTYLIKAFPDEPLGFKTNETEAFKIQGVMDDQATDRF